MADTQHSEQNEADAFLVAQIRQGDPDAWKTLIDRYEGRLMAYTDSRIRNRSTSEDIVQEAFVGFLISLPNYDGSRPLESYLFSICAYKLTDYLRREGRRPSIPISSGSDTSGDWQIVGRARAASSIARSTERRKIEEDAVLEALEQQIARWQERGDWLKLKCIELLIVRGLQNKQVAKKLDITEQQVANFKFDFLSRLRTLIKRQGLSPDVFPEVYDE